MNCQKCGTRENVKSGKKYGKQRYKCKGCGCNFTQSKKRGASLNTKLFALKLYLEGNGFRGIGRIMGYSNSTILLWIRTIGKSVKAQVLKDMPDNIRHVDIIEIDEMWHFTRKKNENYGSGSPLIDIAKKYLDFPLAVVVKKPIKL